MSWAMRYTFHTGYEPPSFVSQFQHSLASQDPVPLARFAAEQGVAGVLYPWAPDRAPGEVGRLAAVLRETGLVGSCVVIGETPLLFCPIWTDRSPGGRALLEAAVERSCALATTLNGGIVVAFPVADPARASDVERQRDDLVANLIDMSRIARARGCAIGIEPMRLPGLMLQSLDTALDIIRRVGLADVGLIFDTAHVAAMGHDPVAAFRDAYDHLLLLQLADLPGRVEPGAGALDLVAIAAEASARGYAGLVDLEHGWAAPSAAGEVAGLERLRAFDAQVRAATARLASADAHA